MLGRVLLAAVLAGIAAGLFMSAIQQWRVAPIIIEAEKYEKAEPAHQHGAAEATTAETQAAATHEHAEEGWGPEDGFERTAYTIAANVVAGVAFALLAAAAAVLTGLPLTLGTGALWGLAGFAIFTLAPSAGLPPELPGMPAGDLFARQVWWWCTVAATAAGIGLLVMLESLALKALGVVIMAVPHLVGAPQPDTHETTVPAGLANTFAANAIATSAVFWIVLGVLLGYLLTRSERRATA
ncbi:MAG: CbtA family protein [Parvibaculaceae bacterium]